VDPAASAQDDKEAVIPRAVAESTPWARPLPDLSVERGATAPMSRLQKHIDATPYRVLLVADSEGRRETLLDMLRDHAIEPVSVGTLAEFEASDEKVAITAAPISEGFFCSSPKAAVPRTIQFITENELFATGTTPRRRRRGQEQVSSVDALIKDLSELKLGDPVVHAAHGIGRYRGLINIDLENGEGGPSEFCTWSNADKATLYVPVAQLALISRYTGVSAERRRCTSWARASGTRHAARPPSRCATARPNCSTSTRAAPPATATRTASRRTTTRPSRPASASRRRPTSAPRSTR